LPLNFEDLEQAAVLMLDSKTAENKNNPAASGQFLW
jgi:hypothetical protein